MVNDGLGLGKMGRFDLSAMLELAETRFLEIELGLIEEDGENPRRSFDSATLEEMAGTIRARGVITPISVRPDPARVGGYIVNHGHRRLRAAKLAGLVVIPAVIDTSFKDEDRIIENIQRDNLDMFEVAKFIEQKLGEGLKQKAVAKLIGKSPAYVSQHVQLLELPGHTRQAVKAGKVVDLTSIADLAKAEKVFPDSVERFLSGDREVTRTAVRKFRDTLNESRNESRLVAGDSGTGDSGTKKRPPAGIADKGERSIPPWVGLALNPPTQTERSHSGAVSPAGEESLGVWRHGQVVVELDGKRGVLCLDRKPHSENHVWIKWEDGDKAESETRLSRLVIVAIVAG